MKYVIGLDLGTTCIKALLFDESGEILAEASRDDELLTPQRGWAEQDARNWMTLSVQVIREAVSCAGVDKNAVAAISVSSQGISVVPTDADFNPLCNSINWLDARAEKERRQVLDTMDMPSLYAVTGKAMSSGYTLVKLMWLKANMPQVYRDAQHFLLPHDYVIAHLSGVAATDHSMASATMMYDVPRRQWSGELLERFGIDQERLPRVMCSGEVAGTLLPTAAEMLGLPQSVAVVIGGQDQKVAAYGAGIGQGAATISMGTCGAYEFLFDRPPAHPALKLPAFSFLFPGFWTLEGCSNTTGAAIKWARDNIFVQSDYDGMNTLAARSPMGAKGVMFFPYLSGSGTPHYVDAMGAFTGISLDAVKDDLSRAVFEGIAYEARINLETALEVGMPVTQLRIFGGGSKSALLNQLIADVTGRGITSFACTEMGAMGAGMLCAKALGLPDFGHALLDGSKVWEPDAKAHETYNELYEEYLFNMNHIFKTI